LLRLARDRLSVSGTTHRGTVCQLPQLLSYPAILFCELAVASRVLQVFVVTLAVLGQLFV
jgi:hypothetical protein